MMLLDSAIDESKFIPILHPRTQNYSRSESMNKVDKVMKYFSDTHTNVHLFNVEELGNDVLQAGFERFKYFIVKPVIMI